MLIAHKKITIILLINNLIGNHRMPRPRRIARRVARRAARAPRKVARRVARRTARRIARRIRRRRFRRFIIGPAVIFASIDGSTYKMTKDEAKIIEKSSGQKPEDMTEDELQKTMNAQGIENKNLTDTERKEISMDDGFECSECRSNVSSTAKFCPGCGAELQ